MPLRVKRLLGIVLFVSLLGSRFGSAQTISVGTTGNYDGNVDTNGVITALSLAGADFDGMATSATFGWSAAPCPASVKIKFFRPVGSVYAEEYDFLAQRGPFNVILPLQPNTDPLAPPVMQTVTLDPPVPLLVGDIVAITNLTTCGGPTSAVAPPGPPFPIPLQPAFIARGDVNSTIHGNEQALDLPIFVTASGPRTALPLLNGRFNATLQATDPRTGAVAAGLPHSIGDAAGYFSLPGFTGDATFPEVMVKMVDATAAPALGGDFWFFHSPLTDTQYTLTVTDQMTLHVRTYSNTTGSPGQLCGAADTSAFPGP